MVEERVHELEAQMARMEGRMLALEAGRGVDVAAPKSRVARSWPALRVPGIPAVPRLPRPAVPDVEQLLGGRVLAWLGGTAVLVGLAFLLPAAVSNRGVGAAPRPLP